MNIDNILRDEDYTFGKGVTSVWVTVGKLSVHIQKHYHDDEDSVTCEIYPLGQEMDDPLAECTAYGDKDA